MARSFPEYRESGVRDGEGSSATTQNETDLRTRLTYFQNLYIERNESLNAARAENTHLTSENKQKSSLIEIKQQIIDQLKNQDGVNEQLVENLEKTKIENRQLKRQLSAATTSSSSSDKIRDDMENEIEIKRAKLKEKNAKIDKLKKELKSERETNAVKTQKIEDLQKNLADSKSQLEDIQTKIQSLEDDLQKSETSCSSQNTIIDSHTAYIQNKNEEFANLLAQYEKLLSFAENIKSCSYFEGNVGSLIYQLEELEAHVQRQFAMMQAQIQKLQEDVDMEDDDHSSTSTVIVPRKSSSHQHHSDSTIKAGPSTTPASANTGWNPLADPNASNTSLFLGDYFPNEDPPSPPPQQPCSSKQSLPRNNVLRQLPKTIGKKKTAPAKKIGKRRVSDPNQERNFTCQTCPRTFAKFGHIKRHQQEVHNLPLALEHFLGGGCESCGIYFHTKQQRKEHVCYKKLFQNFINTHVKTKELRKVDATKAVTLPPQEPPSMKLKVTPSAPEFDDGDADDDLAVNDWADDGEVPY